MAKKGMVINLNIGELCKILDGKLISGDDKKTVSGCYIGDLMSLAMSKIRSSEVWITIQTNINTIAVASLTDAGCVVICDGFSLDNDALEKAKEEETAIIYTEKSAYECAKLI